MYARMSLCAEWLKPWSITTTYRLDAKVMQVWPEGREVRPIPLFDPWNHHNWIRNFVYPKNIIRNIPGEIELWGDFEKNSPSTNSKSPKYSEGYFGDLKFDWGVFLGYPMRYIKIQQCAAEVNTMRRSRLVFWLIRGNGNKFFWQNFTRKSEK